MKETASDWSDDDAATLAAALAYDALSSLAPLLVISLSVAGWFLGPETARGQVAGQLGGSRSEEAAAGRRATGVVAWCAASLAVSSPPLETLESNYLGWSSNMAPVIMGAPEQPELCDVNRTFCTWLGRAAAELVGQRRFQDLLTPGGRIFHQTHWNPLLQMQGSVSEVKLDLRHQDGTTIPMVLNAMRRQQAEGIVHHLAA